MQERPGGEPAYTTVITTLTRLYEKQAVTRTRAGRSFGRTPVADAAGLVALRMRKLLDQRDDHDAVLSGFVSSLSSRDEQFPRSPSTGPTIRGVDRGMSSPDGFAPSTRL